MRIYTLIFSLSKITLLTLDLLDFYGLKSSIQQYFDGGKIQRFEL